MSDFESVIAEYLQNNLSGDLIKRAVQNSGTSLAKCAKPGSKQELIYAAADFADILRRKQVAAYRNEGIATTDVPMATTKNFDDSGDLISVRVEFAEGALHRDSWSPNYPDGVTNIMALLNTGYTLKSKMTPYKIATEKTTVFGDTIMPGKRIYARRHRDAMRFIDDAIAEFNAKYGDAYEIIPDASFGG